MVNTVSLRASIEFERALQKMKGRIKDKTGMEIYGTKISQALAREMEKGTLDHIFFMEGKKKKEVKGLL